MSKQQTVERRIRHRATALVVREGNVLLLREPKDVDFSLPGGGIEDGEPSPVALRRELREETGLNASMVEYLFDYCDFWGLDGSDYWGQIHSVFLVHASGEVSLSHEHVEFEWWDGRSDLPVWDYVPPLLSMLNRSE